MCQTDKLNCSENKKQIEIILGEKNTYKAFTIKRQKI